MSSDEKDQVSNLTWVQIAQVFGYFQKQLGLEWAQGMGGVYVWKSKSFKSFFKNGDKIMEMNAVYLFQFITFAAIFLKPHLIPSEIQDKTPR